jgi:hypothetical protein
MMQPCELLIMFSTGCIPLNGRKDNPARVRSLNAQGLPRKSDMDRYLETVRGYIDSLQGV